MNILSSPGVSDYQNRTVTIKVTGVRQQSVHKQGSYQMKVPYSQMSQAMQTIHRRGGQVASVQMGGDPPVVNDGSDAEDRAPAEQPQSNDGGTDDGGNEESGED